MDPYRYAVWSIEFQVRQENVVKKRSIKAILVVIFLAVIVLVCWSFRWSKVDNPALGVIRGYHTFGRITRMTIDSNRDGRINGEILFSWDEPYEGGSGIAPFSMSREDRDFDGRWDTWFEPIDATNLTRISADTNGDGNPDWHRDCKSTETEQVINELKDVRGF